MREEDKNENCHYSKRDMIDRTKIDRLSEDASRHIRENNRNCFNVIFFMIEYYIFFEMVERSFEV